MGHMRVWPYMQMLCQARSVCLCVWGGGGVRGVHAWHMLVFMFTRAHILC